MHQHLFAWQWGEQVRHLVWTLLDEIKRTIISWSRKTIKNSTLDRLQWPKKLNTDAYEITPTRITNHAYTTVITRVKKESKSSTSSLNQIEPVQEDVSWSEWNSFRGTVQYKDAIIILLFFKINLNIQIDNSVTEFRSDSEIIGNFKKNV